MIILASVLSLFTAVLAVSYYKPSALNITFANNLIHNSSTSQNITFIALLVLAVVCILCWCLGFSSKGRRLKRRRKKLTGLFDQYGGKYAAQDKEIDF